MIENVHYPSLIVIGQGYALSLILFTYDQGKIPSP